MRMYVFLLGLYGCQLYIRRQHPSPTDLPGAQALAPHLSGLQLFFHVDLTGNPEGQLFQWFGG